MDEDIPLGSDPGGTETSSSDPSTSEGNFFTDQLTTQLQNTPIGVIIWSLIILYVMFQYLPFGKAWNLIPKSTSNQPKPTVVNSGTSRTEAEEEARRRLQERFNAESTGLTSQSTGQKIVPRKISKKEERIKKSSAYAYATTGSWSTGKPKAGSNDTSRPSGYQPSYRPRPKAGGG